MSAATLVSVEEYLNSSYDPDRDYIDGVLLERNWGERDHADAQTALAAYVYNRRHQLGIHHNIEMRVQVSPTRFRVPDICVMLGPRPAELVYTHPPFLCIEILSKDDTVESMQGRIDDYLRFGVRFVWLVNPRSRRGWIYTLEGMREATGGILRTAEPEITVPLAEILD